MSINTTVAFCDEAIDIFVAHNLIPSHQHLDEDEVIEVEAWELKDLEEMIYTGKITDGKTIAALMAYGRKYRSVDKKDELDPASTSSLQRDIWAGRPSELETFSGYLVRKAKELSVPVPLSETMYSDLKEIVSKQS